MRFGLVLLLGLGLSSCGGGGSSSNNGPPADPYPDCGSKGKYVKDDPALTPMGFDEAACRTFMGSIKNITTDPAAPQWITPLPGANLPAAPNAKFTWTAGMLSMNVAPSLTPSLTPSLAPSLWEEIQASFVLERTAYAADGGTDAGGSTFTSDGYVVIFNNATANADGGITELLRVMTINTTFTPSDAQWALLQAAGGIEATVYGMHFDNGQITKGPFASAPRAFTVAAM